MDPTPRGRATALPALLAVLLLTGCGDGVVATDGVPDPDESVPVRARAALACEGPPYRTGGGDYVDGGLERVQDDAAAAVGDLVEEGFIGEVPSSGYVLTGRTDGRALVTYEVAGRAKVAFVVEDGLSDWDGGEGWGVTSWASCDPSELPEEVTDELGIGVWVDEDGGRVPVTQVRSFDGPEHCDWQDVVFLQVGPERDAGQYLRDPAGTLAEVTEGRWAEGVALPRSAEDTGWRREGRQLWLVPDRSAAYLVATGDRDDVERWPAADGVACA